MLRRGNWQYFAQFGHFPGKPTSRETGSWEGHEKVRKRSVCLATCSLAQLLPGHFLLEARQLIETDKLGNCPATIRPDEGIRGLRSGCHQQRDGAQQHGADHRRQTDFLETADHRSGIVAGVRGRTFCKSLPRVRKLLHTSDGWEWSGCDKFMEGQSFAR